MYSLRKLQYSNDCALCVAAQMKNKPLLIDNPRFIPYLVDALLLDPEHPRADLKAEPKAWCQQHHAAALAQLAVHDASREALLRDGSVVPALQAVAETGLSEGAREFAAAALTALSDKKLEVLTEGQKHVMLSCELALVCCRGQFVLLLMLTVQTAHECSMVLDADQWDAQNTIQRLNESLIARAYVTWFDLTNMKGE